MSHTEGPYIPDQLGLAMEASFFAERARSQAAARKGWKTRRTNATNRNRQKHRRRSTRRTNS